MIEITQQSLFSGLWLVVGSTILFTRKIGEDEPILTFDIFQMGRFNQQPGIQL